MSHLSVIGAAAASVTIPRVVGVGIDRALDPTNEARGVDALLGLAAALVLLGLRRSLTASGTTTTTASSV